MPILKYAKKINFSYYALSIALVYAAYFSITAFLSLKLNVWVDETSSLMTTSGGFNDALYNAIYQEFQAPLYFLILWCWRQIDTSIFFLRLLSIIFGLAAIEIFRREISQLIDRTCWVVLCVVFFLSSSFFIESSIDIRRYTLGIFLSALSCSLFVNCYLSSSLSLLGRIAYLTSSLIGIYSDYYFGFLLAAHFVTFLFAFNRRNFRLYLIDMALFSIACIPLFYIVNIQIGLMDKDLKSKTGQILHNIDLFMTAIEFYIIPINKLIESKILRWTVRSLLIIFAVFAILKIRIWYPSKNYILRNYLLLFINLTMIFAVIVASISSSYFLYYRHFVVIYPVLILVCCSFLFAISTKYSFVKLVMIVILVSFGIVLCINYKSLAKPGNYISIAEYLNDNDSPDQKFYVYPYHHSFGLSIYYHDINPLLPLKEIKNSHWEALSGYIDTTDELQSIFKNINTKEGFRLLVFCSKNDLYNSRCGLIDEYMKRFNNVKKVYLCDSEIIVLYEITK
jgi:hypothetical protein